MKLIASLLVALTLLCAPLLASAQWAEPGQGGGQSGWAPPGQGWGQAEPTRPLPPPDQIEIESHWYGWQILTADGALLLGVAAVGPGALVSYLITPPIIHLAHGRGGAALSSLALRVGLPAAGLAAASALSDDGDGYGAQVVGVALGVAGAIALDSTFLAQETQPVRREPPKAASAPLIQVTRHGGLGGWQGTF